MLVEQTEQLALEGYAQPEIFAALRKDLRAADDAARLVDGVGLAASGELAALWDMLDVLVEEPVAFEDLVAIADTPQPTLPALPPRYVHSGVLVVTSSGTLYLEPAFRAAWRQSKN